jgi:hypothetical protein
VAAARARGGTNAGALLSSSNEAGDGAGARVGVAAAGARGGTNAGALLGWFASPRRGIQTGRMVGTMPSEVTSQREGMLHFLISFFFSYIGGVWVMIPWISQDTD